MNLNHSHSYVSIITICPVSSLSVSQNRTLSLLLQTVRNNLHSIFSIVPTPKSLNTIHSVCGSRILSVTRSSTSLLDRYGFGPNSNRNANQRASVVGVRGSFVELTIVFWNHATRSAHEITSGPANSIVFPAKASGVMQDFRIAVATSPIHTGCFRALPPLILISHGSMCS